MKCFVLAAMGEVWLTQVEIHFMCSPASDGFGQPMLGCILCHRWHGIGLDNTSWDTYYVLAAMVGVWSTLVVIHFVSFLAWKGLVNTSWDVFCVLANMGGVWSTQVEMHSVSWLSWGGVWSTHVEVYLVWVRWHWMGLVNTSWDAFYVLAGM